MEISYSGLNLKVNKSFLKEFDDEMEEIMILSAKAFVRTASSRIPKFTGQARGSLLDLANSIRTSLVGGPEPRSAGRMKPKRQSFASGRAQSFFELTSKKFEWGTSVPYFSRHDSEEWNAVEAGLDAFVAEFEYQVSISILPDLFIKEL